MKPKFLFPNYLRPVGMALFLPGLILGIAYLYFDYAIPGFALQIREHNSLLQGANENFTNELALLLITVGLLLIAFSREKSEDELLSKIRLNALYWAILINGIVYLLLTIVFALFFVITKNDLFGSAFMQLGFYNLFTPLLIFIIRYQYLIHRNRDLYVTQKLYYLPEKPFGVLGMIFSIPLIGLSLYSTITIFIPDYLQAIAYFTPLALIIWAFSRKAAEDEFITYLRLQAMLLAIYIYYALLLIANLFLYSLLFLDFINLSPTIIIAGFIIVFNLLIRKYSRTELKEEPQL